MRRFMTGLVVGAGLTWLGALASSGGYSLRWYHWLMAAAGILAAATGAELYSRLKAEREPKAARISLSLLGVPGLALLALAIVLVLL